MTFKLSQSEYEERRQVYMRDLESYNPFFGDAKHPLKCTGFNPNGQDGMSESMIAAIPEMQAEVVKRLHEAFEKTGATEQEIAEFWGLQRSSHKQVSDALNKPDKLSADKCIRICATLGVSPNHVRGNDHMGDFGPTEGTTEIMTSDEIASIYKQLDESSKRSITHTVKAMLQAQRATERTGKYGLTMLIAASNATSELEAEEYMRVIDLISWASGIADDSVIDSINDMQ